MRKQIITTRPPLTDRWRSLAVCVGVLAATACSGSTPTGLACSANYVYGLSLEVRNAVSGAPITDSASVVIRDGSYVESYGYLGPAGQPLSGRLSAAGERPGTYSISIRKAGFAPYDTTGIKVTGDVCHVHGVQVIAELQPTGAG